MEAINLAGLKLFCFKSICFFFLILSKTATFSQFDSLNYTKYYLVEIFVFLWHNVINILFVS